MAKLKVLRKVGFGLSGKADDVVPPVHVDLHIDDVVKLSAQGIDDATALMNLSTKMREHGYSEDDIATATEGFYIVAGESTEPPLGHD